MPGLNGYELCQRIKTDPDLQSVPFLFLKGSFESFDEDKARSCGADGFIVKPFESQEMIAKVKDLIGKAATAPAAVPGPLFQQRPSTAPPPIPTIPARPLPAPPAAPAMTARPSAPPIPPWPIRPVPVAHPAPLPPTPSIHQLPPPPTPPVHQPPPPMPPIFRPAPPPSPAAAPVPIDDFGFDFGEAEDDRFGALAAQPSVHQGTAPPVDSSAESDEDLWSEVSLRGNTSDFLEGRGHADSGVGSGAEIVDLMEEAALIAPEVLFEDEAVFEEVSTVTTVTEPAASLVPSAPISIDQAEIERIVASRVEAAVRQILEPIVGDLARTMIESVAWEVIPDLAEAMIRAEIERVRQSTRTD